MTICHIFDVRVDDSWNRACHDYGRTACGLPSYDGSDFIVTRLSASSPACYFHTPDLAMCVACIQALDRRMRPAQENREKT